MTQARIYQKLKNAMQSGRAGTDKWILEFVPSEAQRADPLMGWTGSGDTQRQLILTFPTLDAAKAYAAHKGIDAHLIAPPAKVLKLQAYADNFVKSV
ncbi:MAG: ETC complex I subunit [Sphingomonadaceae bacterium]